MCRSRVSSWPGWLIPRFQQTLYRPGLSTYRMTWAYIVLMPVNRRVNPTLGWERTSRQSLSTVKMKWLQWSEHWGTINSKEENWPLSAWGSKIVISLINTRPSHLLNSCIKASCSGRIASHVLMRKQRKARTSRRNYFLAKKTNHLNVHSMILPTCKSYWTQIRLSFMWRVKASESIYSSTATGSITH